VRIVLAHGVLGFNALNLGVAHIKYFNGVKQHLKDHHGAHVLATGVPPVGSVKERAEELVDQIVRKFDRSERVHILAHSMGGLDARWALKNVEGFASRVKTLVAIGTPHRGSPVADAIQDAPALQGLLPFHIDQKALKDLTTNNVEAPDAEDPELKYLYVVGDVSQPHAHCSDAFRAIQKIVGLRTANDGVVTVASATRGGTVTADLTWGVDHAGEVGWNLDRPIPASFPFADTSHFARYNEIIALL
jgi:triacylglycerol lipase